MKHDKDSGLSVWICYENNKILAKKNCFCFNISSFKQTKIEIKTFKIVCSAVGGNNKYFIKKKIHETNKTLHN